MPHEFIGWWRERYGETAPLGYLLRGAEGQRWLRVHSLPGSKRYAETDAEWTELLTRSKAVAAEVLGIGEQAWLLVPRYLPESGADSGPLELDCFAKPLPLLARFESGSAEEAEVIGIFGLRVEWRSSDFDELLRAVADDRERATFVSCATGEVVAPYDGGVDLILTNQSRRDALRDRYRDWLSTHPQGL